MLGPFSTNPFQPWAWPCPIPHLNLAVMDTGLRRTDDHEEAWIQAVPEGSGSALPLPSSSPRSDGQESPSVPAGLSVQNSVPAAAPEGPRGSQSPCVCVCVLGAGHGLMAHRLQIQAGQDLAPLAGCPLPQRTGCGCQEVKESVGVGVGSGLGTGLPAARSVYHSQLGPGPHSCEL